MTISSTTNTVSYTGNGSATSFATGYVFFGTGTSAEIQVVEVTIATGAETIKSNGSDYTVSGGSGANGTVTAATAPASTVKWVINRTTTQTQETDYVENDPFPAESHEEALDRLTGIDQEQQRALDRTAQLPDGYTGSFDPTLPSTFTASTALIINSGNDGFDIGPTISEISNAQTYANNSESSATESAASAVTAADEASATMPKYTFSTTTTVADPGVGKLRLNHATPSSASVIIIDDQTADTGNPNVEDWLKGFDDSTSTIKGYVRLVEPGTPANYAVYNITGLTDSSGFIQLAVTHVDSQGTFGDTDSIRLFFARTGDKGTTGDTGSTGATGATGTGVNSLTTRGDLLKYGASAAERLAIGGANTVLTSDGTDPAWSTNVTVAGKLGVAGDTAASDNAAIGYTAAEGLILTGQGSTNDVTIKNDADADVIEIPTGTTNVTVAGQLNGGTIILAETDTDTSNTGSVTIDFSAHQNFVLTLTGNVTLANPSTEAVGQAGVFVFIQDGTGSRTLSLGTDYESPASGGITLSTAAAAVDVVPYFVKASGSIQLGAPQLAFG